MTLIMVIVKCYRRIKLSYTIYRAEKISVYFIATNLFLMKAPSFYNTVLKSSIQFIYTVNISYLLRRESVSILVLSWHIYIVYMVIILLLSVVCPLMSRWSPKKMTKGGWEQHPAGVSSPFFTDINARVLRFKRLNHFNFKVTKRELGRLNQDSLRPKFPQVIKKTRSKRTRLPKTVSGMSSDVQVKAKKQREDISSESNIQ